MTRALSIDLRKRVILAIEGGMSRRAAAARFGIGVATAIRWHRRWRETGSMEAHAQGGHRGDRHGLARHAEQILAMVAAEKDLTLAEIAARLEAEHGQRLHPSTIHYFFRRHGISYKKRQRTLPSRNART